MPRQDALNAVLRARGILRDVTPMNTDCGRLCGAACCRPDEDGRGGMLLFPYEEELYAGESRFRIIPESSIVPNAKMLVCEGDCERAERPLACRLFPLLPIMKDGQVAARLDRRAWALCPLMAFGVRGMNPAFRVAVRAAGEILYAVPEHEAYLDAIHLFIQHFQTL